MQQQEVSVIPMKVMTAFWYKSN